MKKRILLALFLILCLTFVLCACGDGEGDKKIDVKPGTITNAPQGYTRTDKIEYSVIHPNNWVFTGTSFANTKTGERLEILKINCDVNYTHSAITINNFDEVVAAPLKKAFYTISDVSDIGSGYFLANLNGSVVTMRVEYSATYNALYCLVSTATDIEVEKNFFGSFKFI